jgi:hypothetical protein
LPAVSGTILQSGTTVTEAQGGTGTTTGYYGFKNRLINGSMVIDQRNAGAAVSVTTTGNTYAVDRWMSQNTQASKITIQQNAGAVTPPAGFTNYTGVTVGAAANVTVGAGDYFLYSQSIEANNFADFGWGGSNAVSATLSFWVRSSIAGTFGGSLENGTDRAYPFSYTINSVNTWEYKTVLVAAPAAGGTWGTGTNSAIIVRLSIGTGSTYSGTAGAWANSRYFSATGATNLISTNNATFYFTGVQLEKGSTATSFDYRPYGTELALCQRYYYRLNASSSASPFYPCNISTTTLAFATANYPVSMRVPPTAMDQTGTAANYTIGHLATATTLSAVPVYAGGTVNSGRINCTVASGLTAGNAGF